MSSDKRKLPTRLLTREERAEKRAKITERTAMDLFSLDIGPWYRSFLTKTRVEDRDDMTIFVNFVMKVLADLQAESFNERHISVANQIMNAKRTRMQPDLLSWLAVLRMNRKWIEQRKKDFGHLLLFLDMGELEGITVMQ